MAIISTSQKHGSVGCSVFQNSPYGLIERQRVEPRNPKTLAQAHIRALVASFAAGWRGLTEAQRAGWRGLAGQLPDRLGGCQLYIKLNVVRVNCGLPELKEAPLLPAFGVLVYTGLVAENTPLVKLTQVTATVAPDAFIVEACPPLSQGILKPGKRFVQLLVVPGHAGPGEDVDLTAVYVARFGMPRAGDKLFVRLTAIKDGFKTTPLQLDAIVAPHGA